MQAQASVGFAVPGMWIGETEEIMTPMLAAPNQGHSHADRRLIVIARPSAAR